MQYTLSLHVEGQNNVRRDHNNRHHMPGNADPEKTCNNIYLHDESMRDAYHRLFTDAVNEFNERQIKSGHRSRIINDYLSETLANPKKQAAYEMVVQIGGVPDGGVPANAVEALKKFYDGWQAANPNMVCIGAYIHADEYDPKLRPPVRHHLHLDYIPIAECKRGMHIQNTLTGALKAQGFTSRNYHDTAQMRWEQSERDRFRGICTELGIDVAKQGIGRKRHLTVGEYKEAQDTLHKTQEQLSDTQVEQVYAEQQLEITNHILASNNEKYRKLESDIESLKSERAALHDEINQIQSEKNIAVQARNAAMNERNAAQNTLDHLQSETVKMKAYNAQIRRANESVKRQYEEYTEQVKNLSVTIDGQRDLADRLQGHNSKLTAEIKSKQQHLKALQNLTKNTQNQLFEQQNQINSLNDEYEKKRGRHESDAAFRKAVSEYEPQFANDILVMMNYYGYNVDEWPAGDMYDLIDEIMTPEPEPQPAFTTHSHAHEHGLSL